MFYLYYSLGSIIKEITNFGLGVLEMLGLGGLGLQTA